jgi:CRISPR-associated protein Cst2
MNGERPITGVSIAARLTLAAHALNNEGSRNNAILPRQVDVVHGDDVIQTNAISGDSVKHTFVDHLRVLALEADGSDEGGVPLCSACRRGDPNRLNADPQFQELARNEKIQPEGILDAVVQRCIIDDVSGLLVTLGKRNAPRRSTAQFGWMVGRPDLVRTGRYMHLKLVPGAPGAESEGGSNLGQNLFTRPASSGEYAFVGSFDLARIGVNDVSWKPVVGLDDRRRRARMVLEALFRTVANPGGAQRNTQLPHVESAEGAICIARSSLPPALWSPLAEDYRDQMESIASAFNRDIGDLEVRRFDTIGRLGELLTQLVSGPLIAG